MYETLQNPKEKLEEKLTMRGLPERAICFNRKN